MQEFLFSGSRLSFVPGFPIWHDSCMTLVKGSALAERVLRTCLLVRDGQYFPHDGVERVVQICQIVGNKDYSLPFWDSL